MEGDYILVPGLEGMRGQYWYAHVGRAGSGGIAWWPHLSCLQCGHKWQKEIATDLKHKKPAQWAPWNYEKKGQQWPKKSYQQALLDPPPGLTGGGQGRKKKTKAKIGQDLHQALGDHWKDLPAGLQQQAQKLGLAPVDSGGPSPTGFANHPPGELGEFTAGCGED